MCPPPSSAIPTRRARWQCAQSAAETAPAARTAPATSPWAPGPPLPVAERSGPWSARRPRAASAGPWRARCGSASGCGRRRGSPPAAPTPPAAPRARRASTWGASRPADSRPSSPSGATGGRPGGCPPPRLRMDQIPPALARVLETLPVAQQGPTPQGGSQPRGGWPPRRSAQCAKQKQKRLRAPAAAGRARWSRGRPWCRWPWRRWRPGGCSRTHPGPA
mmetsp:Transcript_22797/g.64596  ORF Transcript_22797/g.64596 Transcript_22797/m.64596 type:complete len:220 (-) Transcript_22797:284-943(-)